MAINVLPIGAGTLTIGGDITNDFSEQVTSCTLVPSVDVGDPINVLSGGQAPGDRSESWTLEGSILQDLGATESKVEWLFEHRGEQHPFEFVPNTSKGRAVTGQLTVEAVNIGGDVKTKPTSDFAFTLVGEPTLGEVGAGAQAAGGAQLLATDDDELAELDA